MHVRLTSMAGSAAGMHAVDGLLLNVTPIGMACRVPAAELELLPSEGGVVVADFDLAATTNGGDPQRRQAMTPGRGQPATQATERLASNRSAKAGGRKTAAKSRRNPDREPFNLQAIVRSVTQAGTPGYFVLGMEFVFERSASSEQHRLRSTLME